MSPWSSPGRLGILLPVALSSIFLLSANCAAQQLKVLAPHRPLAPRLEKRLPVSKPVARQSATGGLWMTDANWKAALYLKSGLKTDSITVTPTLYLSNGQRYPLKPVTLDPSGTAIVDIGQALESVGIAPYATLSGYAEIEYQWPWATVSATVKNVDVVNSLIYIFGLQPSPDWHPEHPESFPARLPSSFEGLWWKQEKDVSGFLALSNVTGQAIHATIRLTGKGDAQLASYQVTVSPHGTKMVTMDELKTAADDTGGIYLTHDGPERGLDINGGLQDKAPGYSARLQMWPQPQPASASQPQSPQALSISELGLMTGAADQMMNFPYGTVFTPYSLVRNISEQSATLTPELWWMSGGSPHSATLPQMTLSPHQTVNLNAPAMLAAAGLKDFNGSVNLILDTKAQSGGLLMSSGSVDQKNTYVFEVMPHGVVEGAAKELCYWSTGNGDDTMVTLWNPADEPQDLSFTLFFTGGQYVYPIHLGPRETRTMNVSDILHTSNPDGAGNVIPAGLTEGSAEIAGSLGEQQQILLSLDVATYNVRKATCGVVCWECDGMVDAAIDLSPFAVAVGGTTGEILYETSNTGYQYGANASWRSSATSIATVNGTGVVSGVRAGSLTLYGNDLYQETEGVGWYCTDMYFYCPTEGFSASTGGSSASPPTVSFSFFPGVAVGATGTIVATVTPTTNAIPISLSTAGGAAVVTPPGTFKASTNVVVKGLVGGVATLTASITNADGSKRTVGWISFPVVAVTFQLVNSDGSTSSLPSPARIGISSTTDDCNGNPLNHDRTQTIRAVVTPPSETPSVVITQNAGSGGTLSINNPQYDDLNGIITINVVGTARSTSQGDVQMVATDTTVGAEFNQPVSVIVPFQIATPHLQPSQQVTGTNIAINACTSPSVIGIGNNDALDTDYSIHMTITVWDQFGAPVGDLYAGAALSETSGTTNYPINQALTSNSTYTDPVGPGYISATNLSPEDPRVAAWPSQPLGPFTIASNQSANATVQVDGFSIGTISNRTWTSTNPNTVTVTWP